MSWDNRHASGFIILHVIFLAGLYLAWRADLLVPLFMHLDSGGHADRASLAALIAPVVLIGMGAAALRRWDDVKILKNTLPTLGLLGTVIGFAMGIEGIAIDAPDLKMLGLHTALNTTITGLIGSLWLLICERVLKP